jgi:site-specific DNA recombinase
VELFDDHGVSFVSVTQQFNTTTSMGRLTLNADCIIATRGI